MLDAEDVQLTVGQADAAQHKTVAAQCLDGVDAHAAHHFLELVIPCSEQVDETLGADIRIQALDQLRTLGCNAPVALAGLAGAAQVAAHCQQSRGADIACVRAERDSLEQIGGVADGAADNDRNLITDALITQALINSSQRQLDRDADVIADAGRSCAGAAAVAVDSR